MNRPIHESDDSGNGTANRPRRVLTQHNTRNPTLLSRLSGVFLLRMAARTFLALLFQEPPRSTRTTTTRRQSTVWIRERSGVRHRKIQNWRSEVLQGHDASFRHF